MKVKNKKSPMDRMVEARGDLLIKSCFYALVALKQKLVEDSSTDTCYVDGVHLGFNPEFIDQTTSNERIGLWVHEILHLIFLHHLRRGDRDPMLWNIACDLAINPLILQAGFKMPEGYLYDARFINMTAEKIYDILLQEAQDQAQNQNQDSDDNQDNSDNSDQSQDNDNDQENQDETGDQSQDNQDQDSDQDQNSEQDENQSQDDQGSNQSQDDQSQDEQDQSSNQDTSDDEKDDTGDDSYDDRSDDNSGQSQDQEDDQGSDDSQNTAEGDSESDSSGKSDTGDSSDQDQTDHDNSGQNDSQDRNQSNSTDSGSTSGSGTQTGSDEGQSVTGNFKPQTWGEVRDYPGETGNATEMEKKIHEQEILMSITEAAQIAAKVGNMPGNIMAVIEDLLEPKISWRDAVARFLDQSIDKGLDWSKPNRRYTGSGIYLPRTNRPHLGEVLLVFDTSGSVDFMQLQIMATEVQELVAEFDIDIVVLYADTDVRGSEIITKDDVPIDLHPFGGGGTAFSPTFKYIEEHNDEYDPVCIIYMTDGQCTDYPAKEPDVPVLWVITNWRDFKQLRKSYPQINPPWGEIVPYEK